MLPVRGSLCYYLCCAQFSTATRVPASMSAFPMIIEDDSLEETATASSLVDVESGAAAAKRSGKNSLMTHAQSLLLLKKLLHKKKIIPNEPVSLERLSPKMMKILEKCTFFDYQEQRGQYVPIGVTTLSVDVSSGRIVEETSSQSTTVIRFGLEHCSKFQVSKEHFSRSVHAMFFSAEHQMIFVAKSPKVATEKSVKGQFASFFIAKVSAQKAAVEEALSLLDPASLQSVVDGINQGRLLDSTIQQLQNIRFLASPLAVDKARLAVAALQQLLNASEASSNGAEPAAENVLADRSNREHQLQLQEQQELLQEPEEAAAAAVLGGSSNGSNDANDGNDSSGSGSESEE